MCYYSEFKLEVQSSLPLEFYYSSYTVLSIWYENLAFRFNEAHYPSSGLLVNGLSLSTVLEW